MTGDETFYQELGRRIRAARKKSHFTQEALALKISLNRTSITNIEQGRQQLLVHTLVEIANVLDVAPESLLPKIHSSSSEELDELLKDQMPQAREWIKTFRVDTDIKE